MEVPLPSGRAGRLAALGITVVIVGLIWLAAVAPLLDWHADRAELLDQRRALLRRMEGIAQMMPELTQQASAGAGASSGAAPASLLDGATDAIAAAALQQLVQDMAARAGAGLSSAETLPATPVAAYRRIGLRVSVNARWSVLVGLLQMVEQASPRMLVDDLQLQSPRLVVQPPDPAMNAQFTVTAFRAATASGSPVATR